MKKQQNLVVFLIDFPNAQEKKNHVEMFKSTGHTGKIDKIQKTLSEGNTGKTGNTALMESPKE